MIKKLLIKLRLIKSESRQTKEYLESLGLYDNHHNSRIDALTPSLIRIGKNFVSAPGSMIISHDSSLILSEGILKYGKVLIGDNVFLGANAVILPETSIGDNCIIGAGAVVKGEFGPNLVIAGNPARAIKKRDELLKKIQVEDCYVKIPENLESIIHSRKLKFKERLILEQIVNDKANKQ